MDIKEKVAEILHDLVARNYTYTKEKGLEIAGKIPSLLAPVDTDLREQVVRVIKLAARKQYHSYPDVIDPYYYADLLLREVVSPQLTACKMELEELKKKMAGYRNPVDLPNVDVVMSWFDSNKREVTVKYEIVEDKIVLKSNGDEVQINLLTRFCMYLKANCKCTGVKPEEK
jgi:hypothetical protein